jgi:hypothetical protein
LLLQFLQQLISSNIVANFMMMALHPVTIFATIAAELINLIRSKIMPITAAQVTEVCFRFAATTFVS